MADYTTQADLVTRFGKPELIELTNREEESTGAIVATIVIMAIDDAEAIVNSYLRGKYTLPLEDVPQPLPKITADIARFFLHGDHVTETVRENYEAAISWLKDVARGRVTLALDSTEANLVQTAGEAATRSPGRTFTRKSLADFTGEPVPRGGFTQTT
jgi:phage gp36-like protein